jgi:hypothetical protein
MVRQQPHDRRVVIGDQHPWGTMGRSKFNQLVLSVRSFKFECRLPHVVAPVPDCRIRVSKLSGISRSIRAQAN